MKSAIKVYENRTPRISQKTSCRNKIGYKYIIEVINKLFDIYQNPKAKTNGRNIGVTIYKCYYCSSWHHGHLNLCEIEYYRPKWGEVFIDYDGSKTKHKRYNLVRN